MNGNAPNSNNDFASGPLWEKSRAVARAAAARGGRAFLVGGFVRDRLLQLHPKDADMEVFGLEASTLRAMLEEFGRLDCVGESFRVYKLAWRQKVDGQKQRFELDVSLPRRDRKVGAGHKGFEVEGDPYSSVKDAARRRDFTINAILLDPQNGELLDPFNGRADLEARVLRAVDAAHFGEDSLRVLRAVQFAARFGLEVEPSTQSLCRSIDLDDLPKERVWGEVEKWLMKSESPSVGLSLAHELRVLEKLFPFLETAWQRHGAAMMSTLDGSAREKIGLEHPQQVTLMLSSLALFLSRPEREALLQSLQIFTLGGYDVRRKVLVLSGERKRAVDWYAQKEQVTERDFRYLSARIEPRLVYHLTKARGHEEAAEWFWQRVNELKIADGPPPPFLMGRHLLDLGMKPGKQIGEVLQTVYAQQLAGEVDSPEAAIAAAQQLIAQSESS